MSSIASTDQVSRLAVASNPDLAAFFLRLASGGLFLFHGGLKLFAFGFAGTAGFFESIGLPGALAYLVIVAEILGGLALIAGIWTRWVSLALIPILVGAIFTVHGQAGFMFSNPGGGWEFPAFWSVALIAQFLLGDGAHSFSGNRR